MERRARGQKQRETGVTLERESIGPKETDREPAVPECRKGAGMQLGVLKPVPAEPPTCASRRSWRLKQISEVC